MFARALLLTAIVILSAPAAPAETPAVFMGDDVGAAIQAASGSSKIVVVDFTAEWCGPCQMMDRDTWSDPETAAWLNEHAVCIQVDVDKDQATSKAYKVQAMPTVVAIVDGKEFERNVGYMNGEKLVGWLEGVRRGESKVQRLIAQHGERVDENGHVDTQARYRLAEELADNGAYDKALDEYLWLWQHMLEFEPSMVGVRSSFMAGDMGELASVHEPARAAFADLRDRAEKRLEEKPAWDDLDDWITLNDVVGDQDKTLEWFDRIKQDPQKLQAIGRRAYMIEPLLREHRRWADLGRIYHNPIQDVRRYAGILHITPEPKGEMRSEVAAIQYKHFLDSSAQIYAACLAADRDREAVEIADFLTTQYDAHEAKLSMIHAALEAGVVQEEHLAWFDQIESPPPGLREKVEAAIKQSGEPQELP